jgi:hypothetical protein
VSDIRPAYLIAGTDEAKIDAALGRLRARAEREGGPGALEVFESRERRHPDAAGFIGAVPAMSLTASRRYLLADGVERWATAQASSVASALAELAPSARAVPVRSRCSSRASAVTRTRRGSSGRSPRCL